MTNKAVQLMRKKYKTFAKHKDSLHPICIRAAKAADKEVKDAKANFEKRLANNINSDSKTFFAYVRERSKMKVNVGPLINSTGEKMKDAQGMADEFNTYFALVFTKEDNTSMPQAERVFKGPETELFDRSDHQ